MHRSDLCMKSSRSNEAWWARRFEELRPRLEAYVHSRSSFDSQLAADVVNAAALQLAEIFEKHRNEFPPFWFGRGLPAPMDVDSAAFDGLAWTLVKRRFLDQLRRRYVRAAAPHEARSSQDPEDRYMARRLLLAIAARLEALPEADRALLVDAAAGEGPARSPAQRQKLLRLRRRLIAELAEELRDDEDSHGT
jgi:hypothetical protein